ncbi:MAG: 3'-5' exonuclease [Thermodesulfobacteriota bacterium]
MTTPFVPPRALLPEEFACLPLARFEGDVIVAQTPGDALDALGKLNGSKVLGFDTETRPTFKKGVSYSPSLVQFAGDGVVVLLRTGAFPAWEAVAGIIGDAGVVKAGVAVRDDLAALGKIGPVEPKGFEDIGEWAKRFGWPVTGLRNLAAGLLGLRVSKKARLTNWEAKTLSPAQICYAATDAWVSRELYLAIKKLGLKPKKMNPPSRALPDDRPRPE